MPFVAKPTGPKAHARAVTNLAGLLSFEKTLKPAMQAQILRGGLLVEKQVHASVGLIVLS